MVPCSFSISDFHLYVINVNNDDYQELLIKTATSATFVVMIQGSSCLYAGPKYITPP